MGAAQSPRQGGEKRGCVGKFVTGWRIPGHCPLLSGDLSQGKKEKRGGRAGWRIKVKLRSRLMGAENSRFNVFWGPEQ